jgi:D-alanyl-lipoteichoic acid acyltransferase DltB (MBOAT superfamily)
MMLTQALRLLWGRSRLPFQIYCDFSGYSDIARGLARILGFDIMVNFNLPYFATSIREFWQRWHISLSTWLRDYLYISLGGNRRGPARTYANLSITMLLGGLWHGAAWNFVLWGGWQGAGLAVHRAVTARAARGRASAVRMVAGWLVTMLFVLYGWLLFRAQSLDQIVSMTRALADWSVPAWIGSYLVNLAVFIVPLVMVEVWQFRSKNLLVALRLPVWAKALLQAVFLLAIILYWERTHLPFIYFQF